jgi:hypothetical protein
MWRCVRAMSTVVVVATIAGCSYVDSIDSRYNDVNRSAADARNQSILLNIVRASDSAPLNFVAFSRVTTNTAANASAGLPGFALGPPPFPTSVQRDANFSDRTLSGSTSVSNSMDLTVLDSHDFYDALLSPVDLPTLVYFIQQGYSRELLFRLFTDSVRMQARGPGIEITNDPLAKCPMIGGQPRCFNSMIHIAIASGLTAETKIEEQPASGKDKSSHSGSDSKPRKIIYGRFCFDPVLVMRARTQYGPEIFRELLAPPSAHRPQCGGKGWRTQTLNGSTDRLTFLLLSSRYGPIHFQIVTRSTFAIYQFLGKLLAEGTADRLLMERAGLQANEDRRLLDVTNDSSANCFVSTTYKGKFYCVPERATYTKRIFSLLAQLLALKTQTSDLSITPTVRLTQ